VPDQGPHLRPALYVNVELLIKETGEIQRQRVYMGDFPFMTDREPSSSTAPSALSSASWSARPASTTAPPTTRRAAARSTRQGDPNRGAWLEFETSNKDLLSVKVDRKRKIAATTLLRAVGYESNDEIGALFATVDTDPEHQYIASTLDKDLTKTSRMP